MPIISAVGLFCYDEFEETPNEKVVNMSKLTKSYFSVRSLLLQCTPGNILTTNNNCFARLSLAIPTETETVRVNCLTNGFIKFGG